MGYAHFSNSQRLELSILEQKGYSQREMADVLGVNQSTISRELRRNSMRRTKKYIPAKAEFFSYRRRKYSKYQGMKVSRDSFLRDFVIQGLKKGWTPEEISGRLKENHSIILGFKSIYGWIYSAEGQAYAPLLPSRRYHPKKRKGKKSKRVLIPNRKSIHRRPKIVLKRKRIGHFEGDTLGKPKNMPQTLVGATDRMSRYFVAGKVKKLKFAIKGFKAILPPQIKTLTLDNGVENMRYEELGVKTYFCDPYSSWQKGSIENTFQRLRRWIPKKADIATFSNKRIAEIVERMNNTPRKCLNYRTPAEVFKEQSHHY